MILKKVYISRGGVKANLEKVYILIFFMTAWIIDAALLTLLLPPGEQRAAKAENK